MAGYPLFDWLAAMVAAARKTFWPRLVPFQSVLPYAIHGGPFYVHRAVDPVADTVANSLLALLLLLWQRYMFEYLICVRR